MYRQMSRSLNGSSNDKPKSKMVCIRFDNSLLEEVREVSKRLDKSMSELIRSAVQLYITIYRISGLPPYHYLLMCNFRGRGRDDAGNNV